MENKTKKKCDRCDKPAEAEKYKYCYDCWWEQDPRNQTPKIKASITGNSSPGTKMSRMTEEPAYTPRAEYQCDGSTTHYQGCKCHEARRQAEVDQLREQLAVAKGALTDIRNEVVITKLGEMQPDASLLKHYADEALAKLEKSDSCQK